MKTSHPFKVLLRMPTLSHTNIEFMRGILEYVRLNGPWETRLSGADESYRANDPVPNDVVDGAIVSEGTGIWAQTLVARGVPIVTTTIPDYLLATQSARTIYIDCNNESISRMAANFLMDKGFSRFAYVHFPGAPDWSALRSRTFSRILSDHGHSVVEWETSSRTRFGFFQPNFGKWLRRLTPGTAIFAANDSTAQKVLVACSNAGIAVPERLAVLGADDSELLCETSTPTLSSIRFNTRHIGFKACMLLDKLMYGAQIPESGRRLSYTGENVVARVSTETASISPKAFNARFTAFVRTRLEASEIANLSIANIATTIGISRRQLEIDFKRETGRTVHDEIVRLRLERAAHLLTSTQYPLAAIASDCGFANDSHLCKLFKAAYATTPTTYRKRVGVQCETQESRASF